MQHSFAAILLLSTVGACTVPTASSRAVLPPDQSHLAVGEVPLDAAREVTRLFAARGYAMVDQQALPDASFALVFKGARGEVTTGGHKSGVTSYAIGSVFHVHVAPIDATHADIQIIGNPMIDGSEKCSADGSSCASVPLDVGQGTELAGRTEAEVVHGVFSELTLEGRAP